MAGAFALAPVRLAASPRARSYCVEDRVLTDMSALQDLCGRLCGRRANGDRRFRQDCARSRDELVRPPPDTRDTFPTARASGSPARVDMSTDASLRGRSRPARSRERKAIMSRRYTRLPRGLQPYTIPMLRRLRWPLTARQSSSQVATRGLPHRDYSFGHRSH